MLVLAFGVMLCLPAWRTYRDVSNMPADARSALAAQPMWKVSRTFPSNFETFFDQNSTLR